jgi:hypothetical protein
VSLDSIFSAAGAAAAMGWLVLVFAPRDARWPRRVAVAIAAAIAMTYAALVGVHWTGSDGGFGSLDAVARLFENRGLLLAGWVHYLAFDLLVGIWERDEAARVGLPRLLLLPCLALTFLLGPLGWLLFLACRQLRLQSAPPASAAA